MKTLKTIIILIIAFLIGGITFTFCDEEAATGDYSKEVDNYAPQISQQDTTKRLDSSEKNVLDSINIINYRIDTVSKANAEIKSNFKKYKNYLLWALVLVVATDLLLIIVAFIKVNAAANLAKRNRQEIEVIKEKIEEFEQRFMNAIRSKNSTLDMSNLSSRIKNIELRFEQMGSLIHPQSTIANPPIKNVTQTTVEHQERQGYFGIPSKNSATKFYFKRFLNSKSDADVRFQVVERNGVAEFKPLEGKQYLNDIKWNDDIKLALELRGCAPTEALDMTIIKSGKAIFEGDIWVITQKAIVKLSK